MIIGEFIDRLEEELERLGVAVREEGVLENIAEKLGQVRVLAHACDGLAVQCQHFDAAQARVKDIPPAILLELAFEEAGLAAHLNRLPVHVVHELIDKRDGDLLHLALGVGHFAHENIACRVDPASGFRI